MDDFWKLYIFRLNTGAHYLIPSIYSDDEIAWKILSERLSRSLERTKNDAKLIDIMNGARFGQSKIIKL